MSPISTFHAINLSFQKKLLIELVMAGALTKQAAADVATTTAEAARTSGDGSGLTGLTDTIARHYENIAADLLGLPHLSPGQSD